MIKLNKKTLIFAILALAVMIVISLFSSQSGFISSGTSGRVTRFICRIIFFDFRNLNAAEQQFLVEQLNPFIRKLAHFALYMLLGMTIYSAVLTLDFEKLRLRFPIALVICVAYAAADEIHQLYIPERSGKVTDVLLDSVGVIAGIIIIRIIILIFCYIRTFLSEKK